MPDETTGSIEGGPAHDDDGPAHKTGPGSATDPGHKSGSGAVPAPATSPENPGEVASEEGRQPGKAGKAGSAGQPRKAARPGKAEPPEEAVGPARRLTRIAVRRATAQKKRVEVPDPALDIEQRKREAGVEKELPFGRPGQPLGRAHPFMFGFTGALGVFAAWTLIQAISSAHQVLILIVVSLFLAIGLNPTVERLQRTGMARGWAVAVVFIGVVVVFVGFGFAIVPPLTQQITEFIDHIPSYTRQLQENAQIRELDQRFELLSKLEKTVSSADFGERAMNGIVGVGKVVLSGIFSTLTVLILTLYFLGSLPAIKTFSYRLAPRSRRARVALLGDEILVRIGGYVAGSATVALIAGVTAYVFMLIAGIPFALPLSLIVAITALVPLVGATIGAAMVSIVAFFDGTVTGIVAIIFFLIYQQVENYLIHPRVMKRAVDVHPAVTVIAALIGGTLLGVVGALLAIPTAASLSLIVREVVLPRQELT